MSPTLGYIIYETMIEMIHRNTDDKRDDAIIQFTIYNSQKLLHTKLTLSRSLSDPG